MFGKRIKACHVISSIDKNSGGTSTYLQFLTNCIVGKIDVEIISVKSQNDLKFNSKIALSLVGKGTYNFFQYLIRLREKLNLINCDIYHGNGLWESPVNQMCRIAKLKGIPYIISPHGMLEPWSLEQSKWKKKLAMFLFQKNDIRNATVLHVTADMEAQNIRNLGFKNPIAVIPNGIDLAIFPIIEKNSKYKKTVLFLSRIHPKKGIEFLIDAWSELDTTLKVNWQVEIAGNGDQNYVNDLRNSIEKNGLSEEIKIIGPQFGKAKQDTYNRADLFVLPSHSENFGIVIAEALACNIPVITTIGTPWQELESTQCGWWVNVGVEPLKGALEEALQTPPETLFQMGENGRKLVEEKYSIEAVAKQMLELYAWVLEKGEKPEFVKVV